MSTLITVAAAIYLLIALLISAATSFQAENRRISRLIEDFDRDHPQGA